MVYFEMQVRCQFFTYITEVGSVQFGQDNLRTIYNQGEFPEAFFGVFGVMPLQEESKHHSQTQKSYTTRGDT